MLFNQPTLVLLLLLAVAVAVAAPVLIKGFMRRGKGVKYEQDFLIQRAPQLMSVFTIFLLIVTGMIANDIIQIPGVVPFVALSTSKTLTGFPLYMAWFGNVIFVSGLIFMVGGWISLGEMFSTDAEVMENHTVRDTGLLAYVMHPAYSGIIQSLLGASVVLTSPFCILFTVCMVAPLWLRRAKYEEALLLEALGEPYREYAKNMGWRRLVPRFIPIGV
ncbi:MAG: isoprenylcysteine carboxylmethyltransferase family protein [Candidatus Obscuribacterales bacterium]|nr:isoprenylcysteine carboxylmethyltransferase family protein [Candidatus Obscuribacterales bacterium]